MKKFIELNQEMISMVSGGAYDCGCTKGVNNMLIVFDSLATCAEICCPDNLEYPYKGGYISSPGKAVCMLNVSEKENLFTPCFPSPPDITPLVTSMEKMRKATLKSNSFSVIPSGK